MSALLAQRSLGRLRLRLWRHPGERPHRDRGAVHPSTEITWVHDGALDYRLGRRLWTASSDRVVLLPAGVTHDTSFSPGARVSTLHLDPALVAQLAPALGRRTGPALLPRSKRFAILARLLSDELARGEPGQQIAAQALTDALVVELLRGEQADTVPSKRDPVSPRIARVVQRIHASHADALSLDDLAQTAGLTRYHFSRIFRREVGQSPYRFLQEVRLQQAARRLERGQSVTEAALSVGFRDLSRFARLFRQRFGCSPSEARPSRRRVAVKARSA